MKLFKKILSVILILIFFSACKIFKPKCETCPHWSKADVKKTQIKNNERKI
jgi:hypothetical protein